MLVFPTPPDAETGRWVVRFDAVSLLTEPDEVFGQRVAQLDAGDEVEMTGHRAAWYQMRTPRGQEGWLQSMAVEPYVDGHRPTMAPSPVEPAPEAPVDEVAEESQLDSLLAAIVADRARAAEAAAAEAAAAQAAASVATSPPATTEPPQTAPTRRKRSGRPPAPPGAEPRPTPAGFS